MRLRFALFTLVSSSLLFAVDADHDFSGKWIISTGDRLSVPFEDLLTIEQNAAEIRCSSGGATWTYALNGTERKVQVDGAARHSVVKWEGAALLINTIVTGKQDYVLMDRWRLSRDHETLTVTRQIIRGVKQEEGTMKYRRDRATPPPPIPSDEPSEPVRQEPPRPAPARAAAPTPAPVPLRRREEPAPHDIVVSAGTRIPLSFRNTVDTKHAREGDRIYLQTAFPVAQDGRVVIPRGSFVNGVITAIKHAGHMSKGELFIRFDTLQLPNGVARDLRSRPAGEDEGKISGESTGVDARRTAQGAGAGATTGVMTGAAAGHAGMGAGIGGAAGGIASVLLSKGSEPPLPQGTTVEMVLDRNLRFRPDEIQ